MKSLLILAVLFSSTVHAASFETIEKESSKYFNFDQEIYQPGVGSRTCCAFGAPIRLAFMPLIKIDQTIGGESLNTHSFSGSKNGPKEEQGEVFTCRAGFLDSSHVRHADDFATQ